MKRFVRTIVPPSVVMLLLLATWQVIFNLRVFEPILLPSPYRVYEAFVDQGDSLLAATRLTATAAAIAFGLSVTIGTLIAFAFSQSTWIRNGFYPYTIFLQTVPIVAIAPVVINLFGHGIQSVILIATVISIFPIIASVTQGLISVPQNLTDLFSVYGASRTQILLKLRFPHAIRFLLTGARTSAGLAVVGAIVGEFFAGYSTTEKGLGYVILNSDRLLQTNVLFAAIILSTFLGLATFAAITFVTAKLGSVARVTENEGT